MSCLLLKLLWNNPKLQFLAATIIMVFLCLKADPFVWKFIIWIWCLTIMACFCLHSVICYPYLVWRIKSFFFYVQNFCAVRNESVWPWFNLSISYGYTSNVSRTVLECLGFNIETAKASLPGLQLFTTTCGEIIRLFVKFLNGLFIFMKL